MSVGGFTPYQQLGSFSQRKEVWTYSVFFSLFQSWVTGEGDLGVGLGREKGKRD